VLPVVSLAARTAAKSAPNCGNGQNRFATDGHGFTINNLCACVLDYGLEDFCELRFVSRRKWRFHRFRHTTSVANLSDGSL
jgi:hypothetical protein